MKNTTKIITLSAVVLVSMLFMTGCPNNARDEKSKTDESAKTYTVKGSLEFSESSERSATTSFLRLDNLNYSVVAYKGTKDNYSTQNPVAAELGGGVDYVTYTLNLPEAGNWYIKASTQVTVSDNTLVDVLSSYQDITVPEQLEPFQIDPITLNMNSFSLQTTGSIDLKIYDHTNKIDKVSMTAKDLINNSGSVPALENTFYFLGTYEQGVTERCADFKLSRIVAGCYEITFTFKDSNDKTLYSCKEVVTVLGGFVTDKWLQGSSGAAHLVYDSYYNASKFIITNDLLAAQEQAGDLDYPIVLWNAPTEENVPYECEREWDEFNQKYAYFIITQKTKSEQYQEGIKAFGKIENGTTISSSMGNPTKAFCFDNHTDPVVIYTYDDNYGEIDVYTESYSYYKEKGSIYLETIINERLDEGYELDEVYPAIAFNYPYLFFFFKTVQDTYYLGAIDTDADDLTDPANFTFCDVNQDIDDITCMDVDVVDSDKTMICYASRYANGHDNEIYIRGLTFTGNSIAFDPSIDSTVVVDAGTEELGITLPGSSSIELEVTDLQILNDILYIALSMHGSASDMYTGGYVKINDEYIKKPIVISNGGIAKIDLSAPGEGGVYSFANWDQGKTLLGWHTGKIYSDNEGSGARPVTLPPYPYNDDDEEWDDTKFFYGARKFVARKPDELVIADDGGYLDTEYDDDGNLVLGSVESANKNRVVTVNLTTETFRAIDVDVTFDKTFGDFDGNDSYFGTGFVN